MNFKKTEGLLTAPFTPFHTDGSLNLHLIPALVDKMIADGVTGAFVCGSNGEGPNMTSEERKAVAEAFVRASAGRLRIWVHVGHSSIRESQDLMRHARDIGADAASSVAAFYFKPSSVQNLVDCMSEIASAAPDFPFYYYHIPTLTGVGMDMTEFLRLGEAVIPNLQGIKYTATTIWEYQACLNYAQGRFDVLYGFDEMLLPALSVGAKAAIGSTYNFAAPLYLDVMAAYRSGQQERAQQLMINLVNMVRVFVKFPPIPAQRAIMHMLGFDLGPCRLPLTQLTNGQYTQLKTELEQIGFLQSLTTQRPTAVLGANS
ncbi:dihydrodipicolinate synthase family protein [Larkinella rosea]|uniref:N-acetylneuraminate lyase n=1 Tax=Larkinella rosea TaxID=2025312 RepID=A0A3P1BUK8_9BACT|nr:dihydrodipicolinate synthase family protein [Larkinella rosea]RRB04795.1 N-acetylneuraminate lyase [Larkinella rosea]